MQVDMGDSGNYLLRELEHESSKPTPTPSKQRGYKVAKKCHEKGENRGSPAEQPRENAKQTNESTATSPLGGKGERERVEEKWQSLATTTFQERGRERDENVSLQR